MNITIIKQPKRCDEAGTTSATVEIGRVSVDITTFDHDGCAPEHQVKQIEKVLDLFKAIAALSR